jgi:AcrR family transcriptional regulator
VSGLRERKKAETRRSIQEHAVRLFLAKGYDDTTVEEIAAAAGVSHMTFFRYFANKAAVVESDDYDPMIAEVIRNRPPDEPPLTAIRTALTTALRAMPENERGVLLTRTRLILSVPALQARRLESAQVTRALFAAAIADRNPRIGDFDRQVLAAAALAALSVALEEWASIDGSRSPADLVDAAFAALDR